MKMYVQWTVSVSEHQIVQIPCILWFEKLCSDSIEDSVLSKISIVFFFSRFSSAAECRLLRFPFSDGNSSLQSSSSDISPSSRSPLWSRRLECFFFERFFLRFLASSPLSSFDDNRRLRFFFFFANLTRSPSSLVCNEKNKYPLSLHIPRDDTYPTHSIDSDQFQGAKIGAINYQ